MIRFLVCLFLIVAVGGDALGYCPPRRRGGNFTPYSPSCPDNSCPDNSFPVSPNNVPFVPIPAPELSNGVVTQDDLDLVNSIIPVENRVRNPNVQCAWVAGEEIFVSAGYLQFKGWGEAAARTRRWHGAGMSNILAGCDSVGVPYKSTRNGDLSIFEHAKNEGVGVYVQIPGHALVCALLTDKWAYMVNNHDDPKLSQRVEKWSRSRFLREWTRVACCPLHKKKPKEPVVTPTQPTEPTKPSKPAKPKPAEPAKPVEPGCKCPPPQDLSKITDGLGKLVESVSAVNNNVGIVNKSVNDLSAKVGSIDQRLVVVEGKLASPSVPPPSITAPEVKTIQDKLQKLEDSIRKQSGTLHISVTPK